MAIGNLQSNLRLDRSTQWWVLVFGAVVQTVLISSSFAETNYWQVTLTYDSEKVSLVEAAEIPPMKKKVRTPGLNGAPGIIDCQVEWLDSEGNILTTTETRIPLGQRIVTAQGKVPQEKIPRPLMPEKGAICIRLPGPEHSGTPPRSLHLKPVKTKGLARKVFPEHQAFRRLGEKPLAIPRIRKANGVPKVEGPVSSVKVRDTGDDGNRLVLVFLGDGYTAANLASGDFSTDVTTMVNTFISNNSWNVFFGGTNVYRIDVESNEEGADEDRDEGEPSVEKDTYFNSTFWTSGLERLLTIDDTGKLRAMQAADDYIGVGVWDQLIVLVNSTRYGGSGGEVVVTSMNPSAGTPVMIHEVGHSYAGLADEYTSPYPGYPPGDPEPNVDFDYMLSQLKWSDWVEPDTPLPTPDEPQYDDVIGAFEGARYLETGIYRPARNCLMRSSGTIDFCKICNEAHIVTFLDPLSLVEQTDPPAGEQYKIDSKDGTTFSVSVIPVEGFEYQWYLAREPIRDAAGPSVTIRPEQVTNNPVELSLLVSYSSPHVRSKEFNESYTWSVFGGTNPPTATPTASPTATMTPTVTNTFTPTATATETPTATATSTATAEPTATDTPTPGATATPTTVDYDLNDDSFIDAIDLLIHLDKIESGSTDHMTIFDFSLHWKN